MAIEDARETSSSILTVLPERLWGNRNFIWMCIGASIATLGSQFTALALPWVVLKMTGDPLALGSVMAIAGIPQILLLLFGGGLADGFSPKLILVWAYLICAALLIALGTLLFSGTLQLWMIDAFAFGTGLVFGVSVPASFSLIASALPHQLVPSASSVIGSIRQGMAFVGPLLAGALLGIADSSQHLKTTGSQPLFAVAFFFDGTGLLLVAWTMSRIVFRPATNRGTSVRGGFKILPVLHWFLADRQILTVIGYWILITFFLSGSIRVGLPLLAEQNTALGAKAYGVLVSANAAGLFIGMTALGLLSRFVAGRLWPIVLVLDVLAALTVVGIGLLHPPLESAAFIYAGLLVFVGVRSGFVEIGWFSLLQQRYPDEIRGRATSLFMVISTANMSLAVTFAGWLTRHMPASELFTLAGVATCFIALLATALRAAGKLRIEA